MEVLKFPISVLYMQENASQYFALRPRQRAQEELPEPCFSSLFLQEQPHSISVLKEALIFPDIQELHLFGGTHISQNSGQHCSLSAFNKEKPDLYLIQPDTVQHFQPLCNVNHIVKSHQVNYLKDSNGWN